MTKKKERKDIRRLPLGVHSANESHTTVPSPDWRDLPTVLVNVLL